MPNVFLNLPAPAGNGSGAWVNCAAMGALRDLVIAGATKGTINIEVSNETGAPTKATVVASVVNKGKAQVIVAAKWMRATVAGYIGGGAPTIEVGATDDGTTVANLAVPAGNGVGAATDTSALPPVKTVTIGGPFNGSITIEYSEDGTNYAPIAVLTAPGYWTGQLVAAKMRVVRQGTTSGTPVINVGACSQGGGATPSFGNPEIQRFTATGGETNFTITLAVPRATDVYSVWPTFAGVTSVPAIDCPDSSPGDRTATQFNVIVSGALTAGDIIDFLIADR